MVKEALMERIDIHELRQRDRPLQRGAAARARRGVRSASARGSGEATDRAHVKILDDACRLEARG
jgi:hypothetical protein